jgi:putative ABC transport system ATP-binding protein
VMVTHAPEHVIYGTRVLELLDGKILKDEAVVSTAAAELSEVACA